jgi:hypothetical protein
MPPRARLLVLLGDREPAAIEDVDPAPPVLGDPLRACGAPIGVHSPDAVHLGRRARGGGFGGRLAFRYRGRWLRELPLETLDRLESGARRRVALDLADRREPRALRAALARTIGDPALEIAYRVGEQWVDEAGQPVRLPADGSEARVVTVIEDGATRVAALVHDPAALRDTTLARSVVAAVRLALANVRLQADVAERVRDVAASRRRLVEAGDEQRRRLRQQLRAGPERGLGDVSKDLAALAAARGGETAAALGALVAELDAARTDLARFARACIRAP